jgi:hypothetical protein
MLDLESRPTPPTFSKRKAGNVLSAELLTFDLAHKKRRRSPAQRLGLAYEKKVLTELDLVLPGEFLRQPTFRFNNGRALDEFAVPDAIHLLDGVLTIIEIKLRHTADAWYQLNDLYRPIVARAYPSLHINMLEICRHYDRSVRLPFKPLIVDDLRHFVSRPQDQFGISIWSGR